MPTYVYRDKQTGYEIEVDHSISEVDNPSDKLLKKITYEGRLMHRVPQRHQILGVYEGGHILSGKEKRDTVQKERKQRSNEDFFKNTYPTLDKQEKQYFDNKYGRKNGKKLD